MTRDPEIRAIIRKAAVAYSRGDYPERGNLPSSLLDKLSIKDLERFGNIVFEAQLLTIQEGFDVMKEVELPYLGSFRFRKGWPIYTNIRKAILEENNLTEESFRSLSSETKAELMSDLEERAHVAFIERIRYKNEMTDEKKIQILKENVRKTISKT